MFDTARRAPGCPEIYDHGTAGAEFGARKLLRLVVQGRQSEIRREFSNQRRWQFRRWPLKQADIQEESEPGENRHRYNIEQPFHRVSSVPDPSSSSCRTLFLACA